MEHGIILSDFDHNARIRLNKMASKYIILGDLLYKYFEGALLRCLMRNKVDITLYQTHDIEYGSHFNVKVKF